MNEDKRADWLCETAVFEALEVLDYDWNLRHLKMINLFAVKLTDVLNSSGSYKWDFLLLINSMYS